MRPAVVSGDVSAEVLPAFGRAGPRFTDTGGAHGHGAFHRARRNEALIRAPRPTVLPGPSAHTAALARR